MTSYNKWREQSGLDVPERVVEVRKGQTAPQISLYLNVGAIIQGRVSSADGEPIAGLEVSALRTVTIDGLARILPAASGTTAQDGTYQIIHLRAGTYSVAAAIKRKTEDGIETQGNTSGGQTEALVRTFYPGVLDAKSARPVTLSDEQVVSDVDVQMQRGVVYSIAGVVVNGAEGHGYKIYVQRPLDVSSLRVIRVTDARSFSIGGLSPGLYSLELLDTTPGAHRGPAVLSHAEIEVRAANVQDVRLAIKAPSSVVVRATVHGVAEPGQLRLFLRPTINPTAPLVFSDRDSTGAYVFRSPSPEPNVLTVTGLPDGMAVQSITFNGKPVSGAVIDLTNGGGDIDITIGPSGLVLRQ
jgi:hypothetical protein